MARIGISEYAFIFGDMSAEEYDVLKKSIQLVGLLEPIILYDGQILDGRHRYRACVELGIEPWTEEYEGDDPIEIVLAKNLARRHLNEAQKGLIAHRLTTMARGRPAKNGPAGLISQDEASERIGVSVRTIKRSGVVDTSGAPELIAAVERGEIAAVPAAQLARAPKRTQVDILKIKDKRTRAQAIRSIVPESKPVALRLESQAAGYDRGIVTLTSWEAMAAPDQDAVFQVAQGKSVMNSQETEYIEWARWSWNPITGCKHDCPYCYARDIANRLYPQKFEPTIIPARLWGPANTIVPKEGRTDISYRNVFTCSMADLFGQWVPAKWIEAVLHVIGANPQWNFLCLTKFPQRMAEFEIPDNAWMGTTVDCQARVDNAERAFAKLECGVRWVSVEPLLQPLTFKHLDRFHWIVIGGASHSSQTPDWVPPVDWLADLHVQARAAGCRIYYKSNCGMLDSLRIREFPWGEAPVKRLPKSFRYLKGL